MGWTCQEFGFLFANVCNLHVGWLGRGQFFPTFLTGMCTVLHTDGWFLLQTQHGFWKWLEVFLVPHRYPLDVGVAMCPIVLLLPSLFSTYLEWTWLCNCMPQWMVSGYVSWLVIHTNICAHLLAMTCIMIKVIVRIPKCVLMATLVSVIWSRWCYSPQDCLPTFIAVSRPVGIWLMIVKDETVTQG